MEWLFLFKTAILFHISLRMEADGSFSCAVGEKLIYSPWIYTESRDCADLVSSVPDIYNDIYLSECQRQLGLDAKPHSIDSADVTTCFSMGNGTTKYQSRICCPGTLSDLRCFECDEDNVQYDSYQRRYVSDHCNHHGKVTQCSANQTCATVFTYDGGNHVTKMCMDKESCEADQSNNTYTCYTYNLSPSCTYCCDSPLCNYDISWRQKPRPPTPPMTPRPPRFACVHYDPCVYGFCVLNDTNTDDDISRDDNATYSTAALDPTTTTPAPTQPDYYCVCKNGTWGSHCQYTTCRLNYCQHNAHCSMSYNWPYYKCYCRTGWYGVNCTEEYSFCNESMSAYCDNNGTCYDQEDHGLRCLCGKGFHGTQCEFLEDQSCTIMPAGFPRLFIPYSSSNYVPAADYGCTDRVEFSNNLFSYYQTNWCVSYMGRGFVQGQDGDLKGVAVKYHQIYTCEKGDEMMWYKYGYCCPACTAKPCENRGWCIQDEVDYECKCRMGFEGDRCQEEVTTCLAYGDPHFLTFDKLLMHFQGRCKYILASTKGNASVETPFKVLLNTEQRRGNTLVTYVKYVELQVYGHAVRIGRNQIVTVDGTVVNPFFGVAFANRKLKIRRNGFYVKVSTAFGLVMEYDGYWAAIVKLPDSYLGQTEGICGNSNLNATDDFVTKGGEDVSDELHRYSLLGNSWQVFDSEDPQCEPRIDPEIKDCTNLQSKIESSAYCGHLINLDSSPFKNCYTKGKVDLRTFAEACIFDVCQNSDDTDMMNDAKCGTFQALAAECANKGYLFNWRKELNCLPNCSSNMEYSHSGSPCIPTCTTPNAVRDCPLTYVETCLCPSGTVLNDENECIEPADCGCYDSNGEHHQVGDTWLNPNCTREESCELCTGCNDGFTKLTSTTHSCDVGFLCYQGQCLNPCKDNPCENGGICSVIDPLKYYCNCTEHYRGTDCEIDVYYEYGLWSLWSCPSHPTEVRSRQCYAHPDNVVVNSSYCMGPDTEERDVQVDCFTAVRESHSYAADPCSDKHFYQCSETATRDVYTATRMACRACTQWNQALLTCVHAVGSCSDDVTSTTTTTTLPTTAANTPSTCTTWGQTFGPVPGKPGFYLWYTLFGNYEMQCAGGTIFDVILCSCSY